MRGPGIGVGFGDGGRGPGRRWQGTGGAGWLCGPCQRRAGQEPCAPRCCPCTGPYPLAARRTHAAHAHYTLHLPPLGPLQAHLQTNPLLHAVFGYEPLTERPGRLTALEKRAFRSPSSAASKQRAQARKGQRAHKGFGADDYC
jgi:hypothetical protein